MAKTEEKKAGLGIKIPKGAFKRGKESYASGDDFTDLELEANQRYTGIVVSGRGVSTAKGDQIVLDIQVPEVGPGKKGLFYSFEEDRIQYLFKDLHKILPEVDIDALEEDDLGEVLAMIKKEKPVVRLSTKQSGDYVNVRIDKLLPDLSAAEVIEEANSGSTKEESDESEEEPASKQKGSKASKGKGKAGKSDSEDTAESGEEDSEDSDTDTEEDDTDDEEGGEVDLEGLKRSQLKKIIKEEELDVKVKTSMSDDDVREAITAARAGGEEEEAEEEETEEEEADEPKSKKKAGKASKEEESSEDDGDSAGDTEDQEVELKKNMKINATLNGKLVKGCVITEVLEDEGKVKIKTPDGKTFKVSPDKLTV